MDIGSIAPLSSPPPPAAPQEGYRLQASTLQTVESLDLTFTDQAGQAYHLSVQRETSIYSLTYDRQARLPQASDPSVGEARGGQQRSGRSRGHLPHGADGFGRLLHRFLKTADRGYADHYREKDPWKNRLPTSQGEHASYLAATRTVTVSIEVTGPETVSGDPDDWSAESTAARLRDFAVGLFRGGDRLAHAERMNGAMNAGYDRAQAAFGGTLPDIARQTIDLAKDLLGQWADGADQGAPSATEGALDLVA